MVRVVGAPTPTDVKGKTEENPQTAVGEGLAPPEKIPAHRNLSIGCVIINREGAWRQTEKIQAPPQRYPKSVFLPQKREVSAIKKPAKKRVPSAEEQLKIMRKHLRAVCILLILCICLILAMSYSTIEYLKQDHFKIGQNYHSVTVPTTSAAATDAAEK